MFHQSHFSMASEIKVLQNIHSLSIFFGIQMYTVYLGLQNARHLWLDEAEPAACRLLRGRIFHPGTRGNQETFSSENVVFSK